MLKMILQSFVGFLAWFIAAGILSLLFGIVAGEIDFYSINMNPFGLEHYKFTIIGLSLGMIVGWIIEDILFSKK